MKFALIALLTLAGAAQAQNWGQIPLSDPPRVEDHFWRSRVMIRVDLDAKVNQPLQNVEYQDEMKVYNKDTDGYYRNRKGIILAILNAYIGSKGTADAFSAYNPDTLGREMSMDAVKKMIKERSDLYYEEQAKKVALESTGEIKDDENGGASTGGSSDFGLGDDFGGDAFEADLGGFDLGGGDDMGGGGGDVVADAGGNAPVADGGFDPKYLERASGTYYPMFEIVEDRIFDKNKSDMYYDKLYIRIYHVQPQASGVEMRAICAFRYEDVKNILVNCMWKNPHNDAEHKNALEILELRNFTATILNLRGEAMTSLKLADRRRTQMIEFEHNLWNY